MNLDSILLSLTGASLPLVLQDTKAGLRVFLFPEISPAPACLSNSVRVQTLEVPLGASTGAPDGGRNSYPALQRAPSGVKVSFDQKCKFFRVFMTRVGRVMSVSPPNLGGSRRSAAILVTNTGSTRAMCPFFGKCDGILVIDPIEGPTDFLPNEHHTADALCDLIVKSGVVRLVCGFISYADKDRLRAAGIDVRLGSCASSTEELVANFADLLKA